MGSGNGRYVDGMHTTEAKADRAMGADLIKQAKALLWSI